MPRLVARYFSLLWEERSMAVIGLLLAAITAIAGIALLAVSGWFISATALAGLSIAGAHSFNYFAPGAIVRGLSITRTVGRYGERVTTHEATLRVISKLRAELFKTIASKNWQENPLNSHDTSSRLLEDIKHAEALYLSALVPGFVMLLCSLLYLFTMAIFLPNSGIWLVPLVLTSILFMPWLYLREVLAPQDKLHRERNQQWSTASSIFNNLRLLTLHQRLEKVGTALLDQASIADATEKQTSLARETVLSINQVILAILSLVVLWQGLLALSADQIEGSQLFMLLLLTLGTQEIMLNGTSALANFGLGYAALERIESLSPSHNQPKNEDKARQSVDTEEVSVKISNLSYYYPQQTSAVISQFSGTLTAPHWYWLTAPSGHGKTTLQHLITGQLMPHTGNISIHGCHAEQINSMPQKIDLLRGTVRYNLCLHQIHTDEALIEVLTLVELDDWLQQLPDGLNTWLGHGERMLSGGELKRLGIARLLLQDSRILLLDEPTAGIDQPRAARILNKLHQHWTGKLVVINSHDSSLMSNSDKVFNF